VVCGGEEHIATLNYSLEALRKFSLSAIIVVTDINRNAIPIAHDHLVDVQTPAHLNHHQASIWLKTSLHRYLPEGPTYCYLDTDVVALAADVDEIFTNYSAPITFALDNCRMDKFSPSATHCSCIQQFAKWEKELKSNEKELDNLKRDEENLMQEIKKIEDQIEKNRELAIEIIVK
jgi:hypothetical protein